MANLAIGAAESEHEAGNHSHGSQCRRATLEGLGIILAVDILDMFRTRQTSQRRAVTLIVAESFDTGSRFRCRSKPNDAAAVKPATALIVTS